MSKIVNLKEYKELKNVISIRKKQLRLYSDNPEMIKTINNSIKITSHTLKLLKAN